MFEDRDASHFTIAVASLTESYQFAANFRINIQPETGEVVALIGGVYGQTYRGFTTYSGLNINDVITTSGTTTISGMRYIVKAVAIYNSGFLNHREVTLILPEN